MKGMKDSGVEWIGEIPRVWRVEPLKFHCVFGKGLPIQKTDLVDDGVAVVSYGQIHSKLNCGTRLDRKLLRYIPRRLAPRDSSAKLKRGDLVYADTSEDINGVGNAIYIDRDEEVYAGYHTLVCRSDNTELSGHYLAYLSQSDWWRFQIRSLAMGVKVYSVTQAIMSKARVLLPPIEEQEAIALKLDHICKAIDVETSIAEKQISLLERYRASVIHEAVTKGLDPSVPVKPSGVEWIGDIPEGWEVTKLKYELSICNGLDYSSEDICEPDEKNAVLVVRSSNISNGKMVHADDVYVNMTIPQCVRLGINDLVVVRANGSASLVGKSALFTLEGNCAAGGFMLVCKSKNNSFIRWLLQSDLLTFYRSQFETTTIGRISSSLLGNMLVPWPCKKDRCLIADYLDSRTAAIDAVLDTKRKQLDVLRRRRQSLIYEYVTGKRRVGKGA